MKTIKPVFSILLLSGLLIFAGSAYADEIEDKTWQQNEIVQCINAKQLELDQLSNKYTEAILTKEQIEKDLTQINKDVKSLEKKVAAQKEKLAEQCNITYKTDESSLLDVVLGSNSFNDLISNVDFCQRFMGQTSSVLNEAETLETQLKEKQVQQKQKQTELDTQLQEIADSKAYADACIADLQAQYNNLDEEIAVLLVQQQTAAASATTTENTTETTDTATEEDNIYIQDNAADALSDGDITEDIYQAEAEEVKTKIEAGESLDGYDSDIVARAYSMLGSPYSWGGTTSSGFDCSGFVSYCLTGEEGTRLGTTETFAGWTQVSNPQPGDVCVVHNDSSQHTGIYVGNGNMVHAATYGVGVVEGSVQDGMIYVRYTG